ncbi:glycosyltransferase family 2 protein [Candidatus Peregrinibacteria bacterium]|nr:glycosyltransferase family 2 protein [Candidatus Peregrinibacteria bacterium]
MSNPMPQHRVTPSLSRGEKLPISVHVLTWNSGKTLRRALESVKDCTEILAIDGGSTDDTLTIAREFGAKVIPQPIQGRPLEDFSAARNIGLKHAAQPWILSMDSDEYVSPELMAEIAQTVHAGVPCAFLVPRRYVLPDGTVIRYATTYPNERLYFFHRDAVTKWIKPVHERPELCPGIEIKRLGGASLAPLGTLEDYRRKNERYIELEVQKSRGKGWGHWLAHRLLHTLRSRLIAFVKLLWIWGIPRPGRRLPIRHELVRFWYAWKLIVATMPFPRK